jgi:hypothetical protein
MHYIHLQGFATHLFLVAYCRLVVPRGFATQLALFVETQAIFVTGWVTSGKINTNLTC